MNTDNEKNLAGDNDNKDQPKPNFRNTDLQDNAHDEERMQPEEVILDLPDVKDIPGQEFIHPPVMESFSDTTIASDDEEGVGIFEEESEDDLDTDLRMGTEADVEAEEKTILERADTEMLTQDDVNLRMAELDKVDAEGDRLNEGSLATDVSGSDLDLTMVDADDAMENIGEEDEENNYYSLGGDSNDDVTEGNT